MSCSIEMHHFEKLSWAKQNIQINKLQNFAKSFLMQIIQKPIFNIEMFFSVNYSFMVEITV